MSKIKNIKKLLEEATPDEVSKVLRALKGESDDAVAKVGSGKNMEALKKARENAPDLSEAPAYPKNITQDELGTVDKNFKLVGEPQTKDFTMVPEGTGVPAVRGNTLPEAMPKAPSAPIVEAEPMLPAVRKNTMPQNIVDAQIAKPSSMLDKLILGGTAGIGGAAMLMGDEESASIPLAPQNQPKRESIPQTPAPVAPKKEETQPTKESNLLGGDLDFNKLIEKSQIPVSQETAKTPEQEEMDFVKMMQAAQERQGELDFVDNMLRAGITAGSAIGRTKADYSGVEALQKQNARGVENVKGLMTADMDAKKIQKVQAELQDDNKLRDPKSDVSKMFRDAMAKAGFSLPETTSAQDGKAMGVNVFNILSQQIAREEARANREMAMGNMNTERTKASVDRGISNWQKSDAAKAYSASKAAIDAIDQAILSGDKIAAGTAFMRFAKTAQGDDSVVKSEDMKTLLGGVNYSPKAYIEKMQDIAVGKNVTDRELQAMRNIMTKISEKERQKAYSGLNPILKRAQSAGLELDQYIDPNKVTELTSGMEDAIAAEQARIPNTKPTGMVRVVRISDGASKMMSAEQAAKADPSKYRVEK